MTRALKLMSSVLGVVASLAIVVLMLSTVTDVIVRTMTKNSVPGLMEIAESALVVSIFLGLAWTAMQGGHVSVSLLTDRLGRTASRIVAIAMWALSAVILAWMSFATFLRAEQATMHQETRFGLVQWPMYPLRWVIFAGLLLWTLVAITNLIRVVRGLPAHGDDMEEVNAA